MNKRDSFFVKFEDESNSEAISNHLKDGFASVHQACNDTFIYESVHTEFEVIDRQGRSFGKFKTTSEGWINLLDPSVCIK